MGSFALLALLGMGVLAMVGGGDDDGNAPDAETPEDTTPPDEIVFTGETLGTDGPDRLTFAPENTQGLQFDLGEGDDIVQAAGGDDLISGGTGNDEIDGGAGADTILGGMGNDIITDRDGANLINGGAGDDILNISWQSTVTGGEGRDIFEIAQFDATTEGAAVITDFNPDEDRFYRIYAVLPDGGEQGITVENRADQSGVDLVLNGNPILSLEGVQDANAVNIGDVFYNHIKPNQEATLSDVDNDIFAENGATVNGGAGNDTLYGDFFAGLEPIILRGEDGNDQLSAGGPTIFDGNDEEGPNTVRNILDGGAGDDLVSILQSGVLTGGEGADTFHIGGPLISDQFSEILDFDPAEDRLAISETAVTSEDFTFVQWEDGTGSDLFLNDQLIARVTGGQDLTPDDIVLASLFQLGYAP